MKKNTLNEFKAYAKKDTILLVVVVMILLSLLFVENFATPYNLTNLIMQFMDLIILSLGVMFVVLNGGIDFSATSVLALGSVVGAYVMIISPLAVNPGLSIPIGILAMLLCGVIVGGINGVAVVYLRMPSFMVTLSTQMIFSGLAVFLLSAMMGGGGVSSVSGFPEQFFIIAGEGALYVPLLISLCCIAVSAFLLSKTYFGRSLYAVGTNPVAARISGMPVKRTVFRVMLLSGVFAGVAGVYLTSRNQVGLASLGDNMFIDIIAAIIIGGVSISGGFGNTKNVVVGVAFIAYLNNVMNILKLDWYLVFTMKGIIVVVPAIISMFIVGQRRSAKSRQLSGIVER